jgi:hypothetical protein
MTSGRQELLAPRHAAIERVGNARLVAGTALLLCLALTSSDVKDGARPRLVRAFALSARRGLLLRPAGAGEKRKCYQNHETDRPNCSKHDRSDAECCRRRDNPTIISRFLDEEAGFSMEWAGYSMERKSR